MHLEYLEHNHRTWLNRMPLDRTLNEHLHRIVQQAHARFDTLMEGYQRCWEITDDLKVQDQM